MQQRRLLPEWPELPATRGFLRLELPDYFRERFLRWPATPYICPLCLVPMSWWCFKGVIKYECPVCDRQEAYLEKGKKIKFLKVGT